MNAIDTSAFVRKWNERSLVPAWARVRMVSDDPAKGLGVAPPHALLLARLRQVIEHRSGHPVEHDAEPGASAAKRARVWALSLLPVEWLL